MNHSTYQRWIETLWKHGAVDVNQRDALLYRLNTIHEDYATIVADMRNFARFLPTRSAAAFVRTFGESARATAEGRT